ncbi:MAG: lytic transglycosylase domain-containing protein [Candidatus Riflebacteria bacterium]|nr:lytic transglycosylase domain-containing protein [Candidatus Riflebacteria bacterium]
MNKIMLILVAAAVFAGAGLLQATPFSEQNVYLDSSNTAASEMEAINKIVQPDQKGFPITGTVAGCGNLRLRLWPWGIVQDTFASGTSINVLGVSGEFYYVEVNGQKGYMHKNYVSIPNAPASGDAPYYPGDTRSGGYLPLAEGISTSKSGASRATSTDTSTRSSSTTTSTSVSGGNEPSSHTQSAPTGQAINSKSPDFNKWLDDAVAKYASQWAFPDVTNKYGKKVSKEEFMKAIIYIESSGVHRNSSGKLTTSYCGAMGFMQLMPNTARGLGVDATDPAQNLLGGAKYFKEVFSSRYVGKKSGLDKLVMAGCAYNMGPYSTKLAGSFADMVKARTGAVGYGLKVKMCLGIALTDLERTYVKEKMAGSRSVDAYADQLYSYSHGLGA